MKVIDIIKTNHELDEGKAIDTLISGAKAVGRTGAEIAGKVGSAVADAPGKVRKAARPIFGFSEKETAFINQYADMYAYRAAQHESQFPGVPFESFKDWFEGMKNSLPNLKKVEFLQDPAVVKELEKQADKKAKDMIKQAEEAASKGKLPDSPPKAMKANGMVGLANRILQRLVLPGVVVEAIALPTSTYLEAIANCNYYIAKGIKATNESIEKQKKDPNYRDSPEDMDVFYNNTRSQLRLAFATEASANAMAMIPYVAVGSLKVIGEIKWVLDFGKWMSRVFPSLSFFEKIYKLAPAVATTVTAGIIWKLHDITSPVKDAAGNDVMVSFWVAIAQEKIDELAAKNEDWGLYTGPALVFHYTGKLTSSIGNEVAADIANAWDKYGIEEWLQTIGVLDRPIPKPKPKPNPPGPNPTPTPTPNPPGPEGGGGPTAPPPPGPEPIPTPQGPGPDPKGHKYGEVGYTNAAGWTISEILADGKKRRWSKPGKGIVIQEIGVEPDPTD
jgi:hypothetical protein